MDRRRSKFPHMTDDIIAPFSLDAAPVRGRIARLGAGALDPILRRHDYPRPVAMLLGEALTLAALVGSLLKTDGRLVVQAQGQGHVQLLVAEYCGGGLRGYARLHDEAHAALAHAGRMNPAELLGAGSLLMTLDQGGESTPYQGVVGLDGDTLAACAENYFRASEQTDTAIHLAVGEVWHADAPRLWRAGGALMQRLASDGARGDSREDWARASTLFATLSDAEVLDPGLGPDQVLYRLFHEQGARMGEAASLRDSCSCNGERLSKVMRQFPPAQLRELAEPDGFLHARCQFCARSYLIAPESLAPL
jgi:molecular chaperone Hsp33